MGIYEDLIAQGYKPVENEDKGFDPITGKYICRIDAWGRVSGTSQKSGEPYDFYSGSVQVVEIIDGDKATNRFLKLRYNNDADGMKKMLNDLFTAGITLSAKSQEEMDNELTMLTDKTLNIRAWVWAPDKDMQGNPISEENRKSLQMLRVVKEFKGKTKGDTVSSSVPF